MAEESRFKVGDTIFNAWSDKIFTIKNIDSLGEYVMVDQNGDQSEMDIYDIEDGCWTTNVLVAEFTSREAANRYRDLATRFEERAERFHALAVEKEFAPSEVRADA